MTEADLIRHLQATPPSCLRGFLPIPARFDEPFDDNPASVWQLRCRCGGTSGHFLGHPLAAFLPADADPACFVGPLAIECIDCGRMTELLDTAIHGYHADLAARDGAVDSSHHRGEGARRRYACPGCAGEAFSTRVGFVFWYPDELAESVDDRHEDLFSVFLCRCTCLRCGTTAEPTRFGKL